MAIKTVVTRGYGNGTYNGTIRLVVMRGYQPGDAVEVVQAEGGSAYPVLKAARVFR